MTDWDDIEPADSVEGALQILDHNGIDIEDGVLAVPVPANRALDEYVLACPTGRREIKVRASRWSVELPAPSKRNIEQCCLAASRMRDAKARRKSAYSKEEVAEVVDSCLTKLREVGMLRDSGRTRSIILRNGIFTMAVPNKKPYKYSYNVLLHVAYTSTMRRNDIARHFEIDPRIVTKFCKMVAHSALTADGHFLTDLREEFKTSPPPAFVTSLSADAALHTFILRMAGLNDSESRGVCRNAWHVMVSIGRYAWLSKKQEESEESESASVGTFTLNRAEFTRPNVPVAVTENKAAIKQSLFGMLANEEYHKTDLEGIRHATMGMFHMDLDGQSSWMGVIASRRQ